MFRKLAVVSLVIIAACGGDEAATAVTDSAAAANKANADSNSIARNAIGGASKLLLIDTLAAGGERPLLRESFSYEGYGRDPFKSMVGAAQRGPELPDLKLVAIYYDEGNPDNSVAVFRDNGNTRRYSVRPGQRIGRLWVGGLTRATVTLRLEDFGTVREQTYSLRPTEDEG